MKRPQGFGGSGAPRAPRGGGSGTASAGAGGRVPPTRAGRGAGGASTPTAEADRDLTLTEPIRLPLGPEAPASAGRRDDDPVPEAAPAPRSGGRDRGERAARRELAAAERRRRDYERQEVRRFTKRSRLRRLTWIVGFASVGALALLAVAVAYSPLMALREVRVEGASRVPAADVRAAFDDRLGTPLPLIAADEVRRALSAFPLIETYSTQSVPPGTLVVRIVERTPVGFVETATGAVSVDAAGVVVDRFDAAPDGLPRIEADGGLDGDAFRAAGAVLRSLPADLRARISEVTAATPDDVRLELEGATVLWGNADESSFKADVLARLMAAAPPDEVDRYDVSAPSAPVTD